MKLVLFVSGKNIQKKSEHRILNGKDQWIMEQGTDEDSMMNIF